MIEADPLWYAGERGSPREVADTGGASFVRDYLLFRTFVSGIASVDPATGMKEWNEDSVMHNGRRVEIVTLPGDTDFAPVADAENESLVIAGIDSADQIGGVDVGTGRVRWTVSFGESAAVGFRNEYVAAGDQMVVTGFKADRNDPISMQAFDASTGKKRWTSSGIWPQFISADAVLGTSHTKAPPVLDDGRAYVAAVDPRHGKEMWSLKDRYDKSEVIALVDDVAVIIATPKGADPSIDQRELIVIDVKIGTEVKRLGKGTFCASDHRTFACAVRDDGRVGLSLVTFDARTRKSRLLPAAATAPNGTSMVRAVIGNHVILERNGAEKANFAVDLAGRVASEDLPGQFVAASNKYIVLKRPKDRPSVEYAVYKIQRS